jgi:hypothetical protein
MYIVILGEEATPAEVTTGAGGIMRLAIPTHSHFLLLRTIDHDSQYLSILSGHLVPALNPCQDAPSVSCKKSLTNLLHPPPINQRTKTRKKQDLILICYETHHQLSQLIHPISFVRRVVIGESIANQYNNFMHARSATLSKFGAACKSARLFRSLMPNVSAKDVELGTSKEDRGKVLRLRVIVMGFSPG